jgi:hypothetical protein
MARAKTKKRLNKQPPQKRNFEDRDGNRRPTPERLRCGKFRLVDAEVAGTAYALDEACDVAAKLRQAGWITDDQLEAARKFQDIAYAVHGSPSQRSCLDMSPVGHDSDEITGRDIATSQAWQEVCDAVSGRTLGHLLDVFWADRPVAAQSVVVAGLGALCVQWKIGV